MRQPTMATYGPSPRIQNNGMPIRTSIARIVTPKTRKQAAITVITTRYRAKSHDTIHNNSPLMPYNAEADRAR